MHTPKRLIISLLFLAMPFSMIYASCSGEACCSLMGGVSYCDSSAGRLVCNNGEYSDCYCTRHAVMDMQKFTGCCMWKGGVLRVNEKGIFLCRNGGISEECTLQTPEERIAAW